MIFDFAFLQILISGIVSGFILFQSAFVAPTVFKDVPVESRALILRSLFPKLFKSMTTAGLLFVIITFLQGPSSMIPYLVGTITLTAGFVCDSIVGKTNQARDEGDEKLFANLHRISVILTMIVLVVNLFWIFLI
tara:strand:+ start:535 stop:939 length:405 start_codon:yes stop_codon:yes gene_type:complete